MNPRAQGDLGELSAMEWLGRWGARVWFPLTHSPDVDLIAEKDRRLWRVQVKTSTYQRRKRWVVAICTRGGNQSWSGLVKRLDASRGGPKYALYEVDRGLPIPAGTTSADDSRIEPLPTRGDARAAKGTRL
jgi:hypothetical protein